MIGQDGNYHASNVLVDSCDDGSTEHIPGSITWWVGPEGGTGEDAYFTVEMGCETEVDRVTLKNSQNGQPSDR